QAVRVQAHAFAGAVHGIFHVAGIGGAAPLMQAEPAAFAAVLAAKATGAEVLQRVFAAESLDFTCHFSSSAAQLGDFGSCDYALANRLQTALAAHDPGARSLASNLPLLADAGRSLADDEQARLYLGTSGQRLLQCAEALQWLDRVLASGARQVLLLAGEPARLDRLVAGPVAPVVLATPADDLPRRVADELVAAICALLKAQPREIDARRNFADFGFDSISLAEFARVLNGIYALDLSPSIFFSHATPQRLAAWLLREHASAVQARYREVQVPQPASAPAVAAAPATSLAPTADPAAPSAAFEPIAIIGMSGRFPQARDVHELWEILAGGVDAVTEVPPDRFDWRRIYAEQGAAGSGRSHSKWCGSIPGIAEFDPLFFEISPLEAERMDPRQRHLLQESWLALEDAGYGPAQLAAQKVGMFVGVEEGCDYHKRSPQVSLTSSHNGILASRLAYFLDLKGPVLAVNTACSSALVATHLACQSLHHGESDTAIAAGVNLLVSPEAYVGMTQAGMLSPDGRCHAFDARANGMVPGEAVVVVVLKRLSRALADGDPVHAVIRGSGINYDGRTNGITAPSGQSQSELVRAVQRDAGVAPGDIGYVVAHGTATQLGDPVEVNALNDAFRDHGREPGYCALTSSKSNLGHTFAASGLVSLVGLVQALQHRTLPATLHYVQPNDFIQWRDSPFRVNDRTQEWPSPQGRPRIGAVSAFGMSGTNAHVLVQEFDAAAEATEDTGWQVLALSARTAESLQAQRVRLAGWLRTPQAARAGLRSIAMTLLNGRHHFEHRSVVVVRSLEAAA
ncbi:MAG TPA: beta-ketoacyl synthase N-terminal-like domain-containing protein, partial [Ramlibacter sp.]